MIYQDLCLCRKYLMQTQIRRQNYFKQGIYNLQYKHLHKKSFPRLSLVIASVVSFSIIISVDYDRPKLQCSLLSKHDSCEHTNPYTSMHFYSMGWPHQYTTKFIQYNNIRLHMLMKLVFRLSIFPFPLCNVATA